MNLEMCNTVGEITAFTIIPTAFTFIPIETRYKKSDLKLVDGEYKLKRKYGKFRREELPFNEWGPGERIELTPRERIELTPRDKNDVDENG